MNIFEPTHKFEEVICKSEQNDSIFTKDIIMICDGID